MFRIQTQIIESDAGEFAGGRIVTKARLTTVASSAGRARLAYLRPVAVEHHLPEGRRTVPVRDLQPLFALAALALGIAGIVRRKA